MLRLRERRDAVMLFSDLSLLLSLIFGCCQVILGTAVVQHIVRTRRWPSRGAYLLLLISLWFVCSGVAELSVSGMEAMRRLLDMPNTVTLARWRGLVDGALIIATGLLALALLNYPLL